MRTASALSVPDVTECGDELPTESQNADQSEQMRPATGDVRDAEVMEAIKLATANHPTFERQAVQAPNDEIEIAQLQSAEDVVAFFSRSAGKKTAVKFVFMVRPRPVPGKRFRPYDLVVASRAAVNRADYYVVTASAVVHMRNGQPTDVVLLADFVREANMFNVLTKIRFFARYLERKAFTMWYRNIRQKQFCAVRRSLCQSFFFAKRTFAAPLARFKQMSHVLATHSLIKLPTSREGIAKERFVQLTIDHRNEAATVFQEAMADVENELKALCDKTVAAARIPDLATPEALNQYLLALEEEDARQSGNRHLTSKTISMVALKEQTQRRMKMLKSAMDDVTLLSSFIRLVDLLCSEAFFTNALLSVQSLNRELQRHDDEKLLYFSIAVTFQGDHGITFHPSHDDIHTMYSDVTSEVIGAVSSVSRIVQGRTFRDHFEGAPRVCGMGQALQRDGRVHNVMAATRAVFDADFAEAADATKHYAKNRKWYDYVNHSWPIVLAEWDARLQTELAQKDLARSLQPANKPLTASEISDVLRSVDEAFANLKEMHAAVAVLSSQAHLCSSSSRRA